jgi:hypothetical protein
MRAEGIQPLPEGAWAPLARDGSGRCCHDCASADSLVAAGILEDWGMGRTAVYNDRAEQYRLPGAPTSLVGAKFVRPSEDGDMDKNHEWLKSIGLNDWE